MAKRKSWQYKRTVEKFTEMMRSVAIDEFDDFRNEVNSILTERAQYLKEREEQELAKQQEITEATQAIVAGDSPAIGHVEIKNINGRSYRYLRYWDNGKLKSKYIGKADQPEQTDPA